MSWAHTIPSHAHFKVFYYYLLFNSYQIFSVWDMFCPFAQGSVRSDFLPMSATLLSHHQSYRLQLTLGSAHVMFACLLRIIYAVLRTFHRVSNMVKSSSSARKFLDLDHHLCIFPQWCQKSEVRLLSFMQPQVVRVSCLIADIYHLPTSKNVHLCDCMPWQML